jgi:hypothetical protein
MQLRRDPAFFDGGRMDWDPTLVVGAWLLSIPLDNRNRCRKRLI